MNARTHAPARPIFRDPALGREFERRGYVVVPLLSANAVRELAEVWRESAAPIHELAFSASVMSADREYRHRVSDAIEACFTPYLASLCSAYRFSFGNFIAKRAHSADIVPVHQDAMFVDEQRYESINLWVPLVDVSPGNGCLRVVPGSHRLNYAVRGTNRRFPYPDLRHIMEDRYFVDVPMLAGWACILSQRTFHASHANRSATHRVCASALAVPRESRLYYLYEESEPTGDHIDVYAVDDAFYRVHVYGEPPREGALLARIRPSADPVGPAELESACSQMS